MKKFIERARFSTQISLTIIRIHQPEDVVNFAVAASAIKHTLHGDGNITDDVKDAKPLAKALVEGGLPCAEVTFRTAAAKFIVSPGFDSEIVDYCIEKNIPVFPGCISPPEVAQAIKRGLKVVKFFPTE